MGIKLLKSLEGGSGTRTVVVDGVSHGTTMELLIRVKATGGSPTGTATVKYDLNDDGDFRAPTWGTPAIPLADPHDFVIPAVCTNLQIDMSNADTYSVDVYLVDAGGRW